MIHVRSNLDYYRNDYLKLRIASMRPLVFKLLFSF